MTKIIAILSFHLIFLKTGLAQNGTFSGSVRYNGQALPNVAVTIPALQTGTTTDEKGKFIINNIPKGHHQAAIRMLGFKTIIDTIHIHDEGIYKTDYQMQEDLIGLDQVVISGSRSEVPIFNAPVIISRIGKNTFEGSQSVSLADGLNFSPGLRVENNCQNCGFTQLRMNGLDGAYSQILINSRPIFSALMGVYGLDLLPANMIDRVEVVRGAGSVLYGGNAIAGTVNIITKDPIENSFSLGMNQAFTNLEAPDLSYTANGTISDKNLEKGLAFYALNRQRDAWDANGDGFTEITKIENNTIGIDAYLKPSANSKIDFNAFAVNELRRGGNKLHLEPHQADITEQLQHRIFGVSFSYQHTSDDGRRNLSSYVSSQKTERDSYYGTGGRILTPDDTLKDSDLLALNAYGQSKDLVLVAGTQYHYIINENFSITGGSEYQTNAVEDRMPGYNREIIQTVNTWGNFAQVEYQMTDRWSFLSGARIDVVDINGQYRLDSTLENNEQLTVFVPRITTMYNLRPDLKLRASYAQGYRAPQAFDEDLHIETVGGAARFTVLDSNLAAERSHSFTSSLNYNHSKENSQLGMVVEMFYTRLNNAFVTANQIETNNGTAIVTKRNGSGATVSGLNIELNYAYGLKWVLQCGATMQSAQYTERENIWTPEIMNEANGDSIISIQDILRTPNIYGYYALTFKPNRHWQINYSGVITGSMNLAHVIDPENEYTVIKKSPSFFEQNIKLTYTFFLESKVSINCFLGMQNIFNSFQGDFDLGINRDAGYVYGPARPRTIFTGLKLNF